jgi:hypothetical protein
MLERITRQALSELADIEELEGKFGRDEEYPTGTVVKFNKTYTESGTRYVYAALKVVGGLWYLTHSSTMSTSPMKWEDLVEFMKGTTSFEYVSEWTDVLS